MQGRRSKFNSTGREARSKKEEVMIALQTNSSQLSTAAAYPSRNRGMLSMLALGIVLILGLATTPAKAQSGRLSIQQLGDALTSYGKNTVTQNGRTFYTVQCGNGNWKSSVYVSLSPNGNVIWMAIDTAQLPNQTSAATLASMLKKNSDLGPMFFSLDGNWVRLSYPVANADISEAKVKAYVTALVNTAVDTMPLWNQKNAATGN
jgi:hypothetical protein